MAHGKSIEAIPMNDSMKNELAGGARLMKTENDTMAMIAIQRPRDEEKILSGALRELEMDSTSAEEAYWRKPMGGTFIEGPTIKAALALARRWGNCAARSRVTEETENYSKVEGIFVDYETNVMVSRELKVSRYYKAAKSKGGRMVERNDEEFSMAVNSTGSKALRNAIVGALPAYLVKQYLSTAKDLASGKSTKKRPATKSLAQRVKSMVDKFAKLDSSITQGVLEEYLGHPIGHTEESEIVDLVGIYNSIADEGVSVVDAFGKKDKAPEGRQSRLIQ